MIPDMRRVVTGHNEKGELIVRVDDIAPHVGGAALLWSIKAVPADNEFDDSGSLSGKIIAPDGAVFFSAYFKPGHVSRLHRSITIDFGYIISGEIELLLDRDQSVTLKAGDVYVQRGTLHGWRNNGTEVCQFVAVNLPAERDVGREGDWPRGGRD